MAEINPNMMATQMATYYTQSTQDLIKTQTATAQKTSSALTKLRSALSAFDGALLSLSGKKGLVANTATFSTSGIGTASATATAAAGTYSFFVEKLASAHQIAFEDLPAEPVAMGGPLVVKVGGTSINVNLLEADFDGNGTLSQAEIARAINQAAENQGKVTAMVMTVGTKTQLVLSSASTGEAGKITVDASGLRSKDADGEPIVNPLKAAFGTSKELVAAQDAVIWLGAQNTGMRIQQATNTLSSIPGVSVTFQRAMSVGETPVTLTVAGDSAGTAGNVRSFVDAYNTLLKTLGELTKTGSGADASSTSAPFATDSGVRMLRNKLNEILRQDFGGLTLIDLGVSADRNGQLSLNQTKLDKALAAKPDALDVVFGNASLTTSSGVLGTMNRYLDQWLNIGTGQIKRRQDSVETMQKTLSARQKRLDSQFDSAYERYLKQFSQLQALSAQMGETAGLFQSLNLNLKSS